MGGPKGLDFSVGMKLTWSLCGWSKMTSLQCGGSVLICFFVTVENDLVSASGSKLTGLLCRGIAIDLMLDWTSKLT